MGKRHEAYSSNPDELSKAAPQGGEDTSAADETAAELGEGTDGQTGINQSEQSKQPGQSEGSGESGQSEQPGQPDGSRLSFDELIEDGEYRVAFDERVNAAVQTARLEWENSPEGGAFRKMQERAELAERELERMRNESLLRESNISEQFRDFVLFEISKLGDLPFDEALGRVIALNRWVASPVAPGVTTGMAQGGPARELSGVERAFAEKNPGLKLG